MGQLTDNCFAIDQKLVSTEQALETIKIRLCTLTQTESVPLRDAGGRILAEDVRAMRAVPPFNNSAVDGYSVNFSDLNNSGETKMRLASTKIAAGHPANRAAYPLEAWQIFTGAPLPEGHDTVVMQEDCQLDGNTVILPGGIRQGINRRMVGEDIKTGEIILRTGQKLRPQHLGLAASISRSELTVFKKLRVAAFSTGDEIRDLDYPLDAGCIYDSNRYAILALVSDLGCDAFDLGIVPDDRLVIQKMLVDASKEYDAIITSAGVSVGEKDHVRAAVEKLGSLYFWKLAIRPGRPLALGQINRKPFIGLPGNPVAVMVTFMRFARPALLTMAGCREIEPLIFKVPAVFSYRKKPGRREWLRASLITDEKGELGAQKFNSEGAGILSSVVNSDGLLELSEELTDIAPGTILDFIPFSEVT
jgi:molybdopterin molybdotransferase